MKKIACRIIAVIFIILGIFFISRPFASLSEIMWSTGAFAIWFSMGLICFAIAWRFGKVR